MLMNEYELTKEGEEYLKNGLPERNLVKLLASFPKKTAKISEVIGKVKNFSIALKWSLEKRWVLEKSGQLVLAKPAGKTWEEEALKRIYEGKPVNESDLKILMDRNLVVKITENYRRVEEALKDAGNIVGELTYDIVRTGLWEGREFKPVEVEKAAKIDLKRIVRGKRQPYNQFLWQVRQKLVRLGFKEVVGKTIITEFWNFDSLYQAQNHPSRDWTQTYSLKYPKYGDLPDKKIVERVKAVHENGWTTGSTGWGYDWDPKKASQLMPIAHDTAISPITLCSKDLKIPGKYFQIVRCYRPDVIDATHGVEFNQMGGFVIGKDLNFENLLGLLKQFVHEFIGPYEVKFTTGYFPFTEPSCEISVKHPKLGWIESAGAGIFREELTKPLGVDAPVIAWGFGIDRLGMFRLNINDIREIFSRNLVWLRSMKELQKN